MEQTPFSYIVYKIMYFEKLNATTFRPQFSKAPKTSAIKISLLYQKKINYILIRKKERKSKKASKI